MAVVQTLKDTDTDYLADFLNNLQNPALCQSFIKYIKQTHPDCIRYADDISRTELKKGDILVMFGDHPVITKETLKKALRKKQEGYSVVVLGFHPQDALRYGRLIMNGDELVKIVEYKDASDEEKAINFCNSGVMVFDSETMFDILSSISNENAAGEYYLTDAIAIARRRGLKCGAIECDPDELSGANTQEELAALEKYLTARNAKKGN